MSRDRRVIRGTRKGRTAVALALLPVAALFACSGGKAKPRLAGCLLPQTDVKAAAGFDVDAGSSGGDYATGCRWAQVGGGGWVAYKVNRGLDIQQAHDAYDAAVRSSTTLASTELFDLNGKPTISQARQFDSTVVVFLASDRALQVDAHADQTAGQDVSQTSFRVAKALLDLTGGR
jgi:hypothetical protein